MSYVDIPLLLKFYPARAEGTSFFVEAGPYYSFKTGEEITRFDDTDIDPDDIGGLHSSDYGFILGAGLEYSTGNLMSMFDVRYVVGRSNIFESDENPELFNRGLMFSLGFGI